MSSAGGPDRNIFLMIGPVAKKKAEWRLGGYEKRLRRNGLACGRINADAVDL
jgi:hypothetical protein